MDIWNFWATRKDDEVTAVASTPIPVQVKR